MVLTRETIQRPAVMPSEPVPVASLGGEVRVVGMGLSARLAFHQPGKSGAEKLPAILAACVQDDDGQPLMTAAEWDAFGARHLEDALRLWKSVERLSGLDQGVVEKN